MRAAAERVGRDPQEIKLLAVSKGQSIDRIREAIACGALDFGENYLGELAEKAREVNVAWHYQGALQSRKIREILRFSSRILSVTREKELIEISRRAEGVVVCYLEVNIAAEESKGGAKPADVAGILRAAIGLPNVEIHGLMCIPPHHEDPESSRDWFRRLRVLAGDVGLTRLSMGMTNDFEVAIEEGSTMVRVGTGIFGER